MVNENGAFVRLSEEVKAEKKENIDWIITPSMQKGTFTFNVPGEGFMTKKSLPQARSSSKVSPKWSSIWYIDENTPPLPVRIPRS